MMSNRLTGGLERHNKQSTKDFKKLEKSEKGKGRVWTLPLIELVGIMPSAVPP